LNKKSAQKQKDITKKNNGYSQAVVLIYAREYTLGVLIKSQKNVI